MCSASESASGMPHANFKFPSHSKFPSLEINFKRFGWPGGVRRLRRKKISVRFHERRRVFASVRRQLCRMTTCRQPELGYNPLLPHLIVFILITIKFSESCQSSASCSLNICLLLCMIAPPLPERASVCREPRQILLILNR